MKQAKLLFLLITALAFASCRPTARQTVADAEQPTESTCITGEAYTIEQRVNDVWTILPIKPRKDGAVYASMILATNSLHTAPACSLST